MAQRRMMSMHIVDTDAFMDMPHSAQALYMHMLMRADDDGFVDNPKKIIRMVGTQDDDLKILFSKKYVLPFENGVCVIKHWKIHNYIQKDRYNPTKYEDEKALLSVKSNGAYTLDTECIQNGDTGKVRLGKVRQVKSTSPAVAEQVKPTSDDDRLRSKDIVAVIDTFQPVNPSMGKWYRNTTQRGAISRLLDLHGLDMVMKVVGLLPQTNTMQYLPSITTPVQLEDKWAQLEAGLKRKKSEQEAVNVIW